MERLTEATSTHGCRFRPQEVFPASRFQLKLKKTPDWLASGVKRRVRSPPRGQYSQLQISSDFAEWRVKISAGLPSATDWQGLVVCRRRRSSEETGNVRALQLQSSSSRPLRFVSQS